MSDYTPGQAMAASMQAIETSPTLGKLAQALAKAQAAMGHAIKNATNPHLQNRYADLAANIDAARGPLADNGLAVVQLPHNGERGHAAVATMLVHASGEWVRTTLSLPVRKDDAQGYGSALTYARRYSLAAIVGLAQEDDDGTAASEPNRQPPPDPAPRKREPAKAKAKAFTEADMVAWLRKAPDRYAAPEVRRAYLEEARTAGLPKKALDNVAAVLMAGSNEAEGKVPDAGMSESMAQAWAEVCRLLGHQDEAPKAEAPLAERLKGLARTLHGIRDPIALEGMIPVIRRKFTGEALDLALCILEESQAEVEGRDLDPTMASDEVREKVRAILRPAAQAG